MADFLSQLQQAIQQQQTNSQIQQAINQTAKQGGIKPQQIQQAVKQQIPMQQQVPLLNLLLGMQGRK